MLPQDFILRMKDMLQEEFEDFLNSYENKEFHGLRLNTLKVKELPDFVKGLRKIPWADNAYYYEDDIRPGKHPYHEAGVYYIQEPSAMAPVMALDVTPGDIVLDLCAAPGGKSTQIAAKLEGKGLLITNEIHPARAKILSENIERFGVRNALVLNEDSNHLREHFPVFFDKIMVDAPCSGEGMFRKNEEAQNEWSLENVEKCAKRQLEILDNASYMLKPGGRMVYSTCTFAPAEDEDVIREFLDTHPNFHICPVALDDSISHGSLEGTLRLWPHKLDGEGHFLTALIKDSTSSCDGTSETNFDEQSGKRSSRNKKKEMSSQKSLSKKDLKEYLDFENEFLNTTFDGIFTMFGEQLYVMPNEAPSLKGLKVLRPGLHLGTIRKNRFEPSHSLALSLLPEETKYVCALSLSDTVFRYINGETFSYDGAKGWHLITVDGYSLSFGKCAGLVMKNHYPKGLRKKL